MKRALNLLSILILISSYSIAATTGIDCDNAYQYTVNDTANYSFAEEQTEVYIEFSPISDSTFIQAMDTGYQPIEILQEVAVYEKEDCGNLILIDNIETSTNNLANHILVSGLSTNKDYIVILKRDPEGDLRFQSLKFLANGLIVTTCPLTTPLVCGDLVQNGGFTYTNTDPITINYAFTYGEVCNWTGESGTPDHWTNSTNSYARLWNTYTTGGIKKTESITAILANSVHNGDFVNLEVKLAKEGRDPRPEFVKFYLANSSDLATVVTPKRENIYTILSSCKEIGTVNRNQIAIAYTTFNMTTTSNGTYDRLLILSENTAVMSPRNMGHVLIDDVSLRKYESIPDGEDIAWIKANISGGSSSVSDKTFYVDGLFTVEQTFTFNDCNFIMNEDAKIDVVSGGNFNIRNTDNIPEYMEACDPDKFWDGIYSSGRNVFIKNAGINSNISMRISNMENGIVLINRPHFYLENIDFDRNNRAIKITGGSDWVSNNEAIIGCQFSCSSPLKDANGSEYYPDYSIELLNDATMGDSPLIYSRTTGTRKSIFYGSGGGIFIENADVRIEQEVIFRDFNNAIGGLGTPANAEKAIRINGQTSGSYVGNVIIEDCDFIFNKECIRSYDDILIHALLNTVDANFSGSPMPFSNFSSVSNNDESVEIEFNTINNVQTAISGIAVSDINIHDNTIDLETQSGSSYVNKLNSNGIGITILNYSYNGAAEDVMIKDNVIRHAKAGILVDFAKAKILQNDIEDLNDNFPVPFSCFPYTSPCPSPPAYGIRASNTRNGFTIKENRVVNTLTNYTTSPDANVKVHGISLENTANVNGIASKVQCNRVQGTGLGLKFMGSNEAATNVQKNSMQEHYYGFVLANNGYIGDVGSNGTAADNTWNYAFGFSETFADNSDGSLCKLYVQNSTPYNPTILATHAVNGFAITKDNSGNSSSSLTSCNAAVARTRAMTNNGNLARQLSMGKTSYMKHKADSAKRLNQQLLYWQLSKDSTLANDTLWRTFADSMKNTSMGRALGKNRNAISSANNFDLKLNEIIVIEAKLDSGIALNYNDSLKLGQIASLCSYYDGIAVYRARAILFSMGFSPIVNDCETTTKLIVNPSKRKKGELIGEVSVYPNPNNGVFNLDFEVLEEDFVSFDVYDILGKKLESNQLKRGDIHSINLKHKHSGIYFYRLVKNEQLINTGKLVIE